VSGRIGELVRRLQARRDPAEVATPGDVRMLRGVRWRLVAWSGAITLAVLVVLGGAIYATTAQNLASGTEAQLRTRATIVKSALNHLLVPESAPDVYRTIGIAIGGPTSGTFAIIVTPQNVAILPRDAPTVGLPVQGGVSAVRFSGAPQIEPVDIDGAPFRVLSDAVDLPGGRYVIQIVADRSSEQRTLSTLFLVLLVGGLAAVALAIAAGWMYAERALVPIRDSLRRQREFAADASHELRTPLTVLRASVEDLRRNPKQPVSEVGTALEDMTAEVDHMTELVEGLLLLARADSGVLELQREEVDLADAAAAALGELTPVAQEHGVRLSLDAQPTPIMGDFGRLRQLAVILVDNAIRHAGGPAEVSVEVRRDGGSALLRVDDSGRGISPEDRAHVFERFWRTPDAPAGGLGLGLAIASWIVERHGGSLDVTERPGGGARFEVRLPASA
jgi:two-component system, OmpR family, sensor histidine kinase CiaH